jgi:phosphatidylserine/phosphatidylglycerophosphate/cardiolipin synthase-like enzyme
MGLIFVQLVLSYPLKEAPSLPITDKEAQLYSNQSQDDLRKLYAQAIQSAEKSITLAIYSLSDRFLIEELRKKTDQGIPLHIVCDAKATKGIARQLPKAVIVKRAAPGKTHHKILIIDQKLLLLGSANLTPSSLGIHGNLVVGLEHPSLACALEDRLLSMDDEGGFNPLPFLATQSGSQTIQISLLPDDREGVQRISSLLQSAQKSITVAMFTWTRQDFAQELIDAAKRGVKVRAVIDRNQGKGAGAKIVRMLKKEGIPVALHSGRGLLHHKFAYIDEKTLINGSANWTAAAFKDNDDFFMVLDPLTEEQRTKMNRLCENIAGQSDP